MTSEVVVLPSARHAESASRPWIDASLRALFYEASVVLFTIDLTGRITFIDGPLESFEASRLIGTKLIDVIDPEHREAARAGLRLQLRGKVEALSFETEIIAPDGTQFAVRLATVPVYEDQRVQGLQGVGYRLDRTEPQRESRHFPTPKLTVRQRQVLALLAQGRSTAQMAADLGISGDTVRNHVRSILGELDAHSRLEAVAKALRQNLV